ncbi:glycoside hydrolase family protein [Flavivirga rizhaonensis]|uniref:Right-handed parallel beta-helix repeat-containing protein n=1 Tax=Flavivirga rizhaonensis TaxID=2559571 RepID=A0A4S1DS24_9FLAO|nr:hypothetical protein [Flavivirga rizhaonensis]TGV00717.1 hypothetical protein EM932_18660 [Flavivirga rizhaonensis]
MNNNNFTLTSAKIIVCTIFSLFAITTNIAQSEVRDISDIEVSSPKPYRSEGAGYNEINIDDLPVFKFKKGGSSDRLNALIIKVSNKGGGVIQIPADTYEFFQIEVKSNVHLRIAKNTIIKFPLSSTRTKGEKSFFMIGRLEDEGRIKNVSIVGEGNAQNRPKFILRQIDLKHRRVFSMGSVHNLLIENFTIDDELTFGSSIAFNLQKNGDNNSYRAKDVTVTNVSMTGADQGYGLAQTNVGENILLKNLVCEGGMTCRIEAHTGRKYNVGLDNIVIQNVLSKSGKAAVLLQPHSVINGRVLVDGAKSIGSAWVVFLKEGFVAKESKRRARGEFRDSKMSNLSMEYSNSTAVLSQKNIKYVPKELKKFLGKKVEKDNKKKESEVGVHGPSVAPIFYNLKSYTVELPTEDEIKVSGEDIDLRKQKILVIK